MAEDIDDDHLPVVAKSMLPVIVHGISQSSLPPHQIQLALSILTSCVKGMAIMTPTARKALKQELKATPDLIPALCSVVSKDLSTTDTRCARSRCSGVHCCLHLQLRHPALLVEIPSYRT